MAALGAHARSFQTRRARAHDQHFALGGRGRNGVGQGEFAPGRRVVDAIGLATGVDAVQAKVAAHAGADGVFAAFHNLAHDVRVGHVGARHAHHVELAAGNSVARGVDVLDFGGMEDRDVHMRAQAACKFQVRRAAHALHGNHVGQARIGVNVAADDVQKIHHARLRQVARNAQAFVLREAAGAHLVGHAAHAQNEVRPHALADGLNHFQRKAHPVFQRPAIGRVQGVGGWRPKLVHQVAIGFQFQPVHACGVHALGGVGIVLDDAGNVPVFHALGERPVRSLALVRGRHHRQPVRLGPTGAPPQVGQLNHHRRAMFVAGVGEFAHPGYNFVFVGQDVVEYWRAVARHRRRACGHSECNTGFGALHVVGAVLGLGHAVLRVGRLVRGDHQPVAQAQVLELKGLEQGVVGRGAGHGLLGSLADCQYHWSGMEAFLRSIKSRMDSSTATSSSGAT